MEKIAEKIKRRRLELGHNKAYVARKANISLMSLINLEKGKACSVNTLLCVCNVLNAGIDVIYND